MYLGIGQRSQYTAAGYLEADVPARPASDGLIDIGIRAGWSNQRIADAFEVDIALVRVHRAITPAPTPMDGIHGQLYQAAVGFDERAQEHGIAATRHVPPNIPACIFWLVNRAPDQWRGRVNRGGVD